MQEAQVKKSLLNLYKIIINNNKIIILTVPDDNKFTTNYFIPYISVNSYGHAETVSSPNPKPN